MRWRCEIYFCRGIVTEGEVSVGYDECNEEYPPESSQPRFAGFWREILAVTGFAVAILRKNCYDFSGKSSSK